MKKMLTPFLCTWVMMIERHAKLVLALMAVLAAGASLYASENFAIDSDLDRLLKPSEQNRWHRYNQEYIRMFPDYQKTAVVVVSGVSAEQTFRHAETIYHALQRSGKFDDVFAPVFDEFFTDHALYSLPTEGVRQLSDKVADSVPRLAVMYREPSLANLLDYLHQQYRDAADMQVIMPELAYQFGAFNEVVGRLSRSGEPGSFHLVQKLAPLDTADMHYQLISVKRAPAFSEKLPNKAMMEDIRATIDAVGSNDGVDVRITGEIAMMHEEISSSIAGVEFAGMLSLVLLAIILGIGVRSIIVISAIFIMLFIGAMCAVVFNLMVFERFNTLSLAFVVMFFGLGVDFAVHYSLRILELMQTSRETAVVDATEDAGVALGICTLTSALAFLSFMPTDYIGLAELGVISAFGMVFAYFLSLTFIPAWFRVFRLQPPPVRQRISNGPDFQRSLPVRSILLTALLLALAAAWYVRDMTFNYNLLSMRDQQSEAVITLRELQDNKVITNYGIAALVDPDTDLDALKQRLLALPSVADVDISSEHIPLFQSQKQQYLLPVKQQLAALGEPGQLPSMNGPLTGKAIDRFIADIEQGDYQDIFLDDDLVTIEALLASLKTLKANEKWWPHLQMAVAGGIVEDVDRLQSWFAAEPYTLEQLPPYIRQRLMTDDGRYLMHVMPAVDMSDSRNSSVFVNEVRSVYPGAAGMVIHEWGVGKVVMDSFREAASLSIGFIFIVLVLTFRRLSTALLVFVPLILVTLFTLAIAKMSGLTLNMANVLVVPLIFGLGVDACIHVVHRYHHCSNLREVLFSSTTKAVLISALTTIGTFFSISFSPHYGAASIGYLLTIALSLLLVITFVVLPALLLVFEPKKPAPGGSL